MVYDTKSRRLIAAVAPVGGERDLREKKVLTVFTFGGRLERAGELEGAIRRR